MEYKKTTFADRVLAWYEDNARDGLPWREDRTAYRVWVSEVMLQQTRVGTVTEYFRSFMGCFPTVRHLAVAGIDEVLASWSGLGYYARARNLHKAARIVHEHHGDRFPDTFEAVSSLPGIGRSTAGAILALAFGQRHPILDGNVKRVLARYHAIPGWPGEAALTKRFWELAEEHTPQHHLPEYTQAMMDLGATVCTRTGSACPRCPLRESCLANARGEQEIFPGKRPKKTLPVRSTAFLLILWQNRVLLERHPATGIWGGLWGFPECAPEENPEGWCVARAGRPPTFVEHLPTFRHTFTHFHLDIQPVAVGWNVAGQDPASCPGPAARMETGTAEPAGVYFSDRADAEVRPKRETIWYPLDGGAPAVGLSAPVERLLAELKARFPVHGKPGAAEPFVQR